MADRLLNVACAMLRHGTLFNPEAAQTLPSTTKFKIDTVTQNRLAKRWGVPSETATFETRSIPSAFARRMSQATAQRDTPGSCSAGDTQAGKGLGDLTSFVGASRRQVFWAVSEKPTQMAAIDFHQRLHQGESA